VVAGLITDQSQQGRAFNMSIDIILGVFFLGTGLVTLGARVFGWEKVLSKREPMKELWGAQTGDIVHLVCYTLLPFAAGGYFLMRVAGII